jgi:hypothetical protein
VVAALATRKAEGIVFLILYQFLGECGNDYMSVKQKRHCISCRLFSLSRFGEPEIEDMGLRDRLVVERRFLYR